MKKLRWKLLLSLKGWAILRADAARDKGDAVTAALLYGDIIGRWGPTCGLLMQLGNALKDSGRYEAADARYLEAAALQPTNADIFLQRGISMKTAGNPELAMEFFERACQLDPGSAAARAELDASRARAEADAQEKRKAMQTSFTLRSDLSFPASIVFHRLINQHRWRRG